MAKVRMNAADPALLEQCRRCGLSEADLKDTHDQFGPQGLLVLREVLPKLTLGVTPQPPPAGETKIRNLPQITGSAEVKPPEGVADSPPAESQPAPAESGEVRPKAPTRPRPQKPQ